MRQHRCIDLSDMMICPCQKHARLMNGNMLAPSFYPQIHCRSLMSTARSKPLMSSDLFESMLRAAHIHFSNSFAKPRMSHKKGTLKFFKGFPQGKN